MLSSAVGTLARRSLDGLEDFTAGTLGGFPFSVNDGQTKQQIQLPTWGIVMLGSTILIYVFAMSMVEYTFGRLIPTLLMIESPPEAITFEPLPTEDSNDSPLKTPELTVVKPRPITASFRSSIRLLQSKGGFRARFRGVSVYIVNSLAVQWVAGFLEAIPFFPRGLAIIVAMVACAQLSLAWTLIVISEPSPKTWFRRLPSKAMWKKVAIPTAILALNEELAVVVPFYLAMAVGIPTNANQAAEADAGVVIGKGVGVLALAAILAVLLVIPAEVALTRVQASLISESEETIVPFDRSFNGKVVPEIVGGSGVIGMLDAWTNFDWAARYRLVWAYVKVFAMEAALSIVFMIVLFFQLFLIIGKDMDKIIPKDPSK